MKKLARKLRKNSEGDKFSLPVHDDDSRPLDTQEQEELVRSLERNQAQQSRFWRVNIVPNLCELAIGGPTSLAPTPWKNLRQQLTFIVFVALVICYILFILYSIFHQVSSPWELRHHAYFMKETYSWMIISADWVAVLAFSFAIKGLHNESLHHRKWIWYSWYISTVLAVFWLYYMSRLAKFRWDIIWLPFGPLSASTICLYVDHLLTESSEEVRKLHGYMYAYKAS